MRFRAFNSRFRLLSRSRLLHRTDEKAAEDCRMILTSYQNTLEPVTADQQPASPGWALGKRHIFLA